MSDATLPAAGSPAGRLLNGRLKLRHLQLVCALAEHGSLVAAAEHLHIAQPALTRSLREAEEIVGARMFDRGPRGVTPTEIGHAFIEHAQAVLGQLNRAGQDIDDLLMARSGTVRVGTHLAASSHLLPGAILAVRKQAPEVTIVVREATPDTLRTELLSGELDVVVGRIHPTEPDQRLATEPLYREPILIVAAADHPATTMPTPSLAQLREFPWVLPVQQTVLRTQVEDLFAAHGLPLPQQRVDCTLLPITKELIVRGGAIGVLPRLVIDNDPAIVPVGGAPDTLQWPVGFTTVADRWSAPAVQRLLAALRREGASVRRRFDEARSSDHQRRRNALADTV
ncbi:LysR substrate-binding domain-containing protein [Microbacterium sp. YY-01]|uniref:LysR substrate-binding domain-containing protein n=1 Tax=Microbacterium sp. YY-01 TaxID=3421634 RepID=UPI003D16B7D9